MYETILLPFDGSNEAERGIGHGIGLAEALDATVHVLYVADLPGAPRTVYYTDDDDEVRDRYQEYGERITAEVCEQAREAGLDCVPAIKFGRPSTEIVDYAEEEGIDAIVMGSAYGGTLRTLLGSTTDRVVRTSTVPVITHRIEMQE